MQYPALYISADNAAKSIKSTYFRLLALNGFLLVTGAAFSLYGIDSKPSAILAAFDFFATLFISIYLLTKNFDRAWYKTRALAESVKTISWRYAMKAEPFSPSLVLRNANKQFREKMQEILQENRDLGEYLAEIGADTDQITADMSRTRGLKLPERKSLYGRERVDDQKKWYSDEAKHNKRQYLYFFWILITLQALAILFVVFRIAYPEFHYWPCEVFVVSAGVVMTWMQANRFRELAAAYGLAAHEIGIIRASLESIGTDNEFSAFVRDAESAFSREHTQWAARRD